MKLTNEIVIAAAKELNFDLVGFARADNLNTEVRHLEEWLGKKYNAGMSYMERNTRKRLDIREIFPDAKGIISLGMNYYTGERHDYIENSGKVSRYAWGTDYHNIMWEKLDVFIEKLKETDPLFDARSYVDTGPVMDKAWAIRAGLGWMGKHSNIISMEYGSWFFIATVITNCEFTCSELKTDHCGTCTRCLDACPTDAIVSDYVVDANRCISYLTIENKGEIPEDFKGKFQNWLFGCDICQEVCPWNNKFSRATKEDGFYPRPGNKELKIEEVLQMENLEFKERFQRSPISRAKLRGLKRNAEFLTEKDFS
ncbi:MAG: tRNA epoxyqueuosine(34) reductase QueG [Ignavibacteriales bacterium]